jgi:hypothetical protein
VAHAIYLLPVSYLARRVENVIFLTPGCRALDVSQMQSTFARPCQRTSMAAAQSIMAQRQRLGPFQKSIARAKVSQRFGHFFLINVEKPVMNPVTRQGPSKSPLALSDLILMAQKFKSPPPSWISNGCQDMLSS